MRKLGRILQAWGHWLLAALCAAVVLLSALWTRQLQAQDAENAQALADTSQRLQDAAPSPAPTFVPPTAEGILVRPRSDTPLFFPAFGVWQAHPGMDYAADPGDPIYAIADGTAQIEGETLWLLHTDGSVTQYRGLQSLQVSDGQRIRAGEIVGLAGAAVAWEGSGHVCLLYTPAQTPPAD